MSFDLLVIASHPDDAEISCAGTILKHVEAGYTVGVLDLTQGELGTRGSGPLRLEEANEASRRMGIHVRENMGFKDGFFLNDEIHKLALVEKIRKYRPRIVLANALYDRHPDHGRASSLISEACFLSGLRRIVTTEAGAGQGAEPTEGSLAIQEVWRPAAVYHFIQDYYIKPDFVVDISSYMDRKIHVMEAYGSQFHNPASSDPQTVLSTPDFMERIRARAREFGRFTESGYGEGYTAERTIGVKDLFDLT